MAFLGLESGLFSPLILSVTLVKDNSGLTAFYSCYYSGEIHNFSSCQNTLEW